jgi:hypothetical protein
MSKSKNHVSTHAGRQNQHLAIFTTRIIFPLSYSCASQVGWRTEEAPPTIDRLGVKMTRSACGWKAGLLFELQKDWYKFWLDTRRPHDFLSVIAHFPKLFATLRLRLLVRLRHCQHTTDPVRWHPTSLHSVTTIFFAHPPTRGSRTSLWVHNQKDSETLFYFLVYLECIGRVSVGLSGDDSLAGFLSEALWWVRCLGSRRQLLKLVSIWVLGSFRSLSPFRFILPCVTWSRGWCRCCWRIPHLSTRWLSHHVISATLDLRFLFKKKNVS